MRKRRSSDASRRRVSILTQRDPILRPLYNSLMRTLLAKMRRRRLGRLPPLAGQVPLPGREPENLPAPESPQEPPKDSGEELPEPPEDS